MSKKNKVAVVFHNSEYYSGGTRAMVEIVEQWQRKGNLDIIAIFPGRGSAVDYLEKIGIKSICDVAYHEVRYDVTQPLIRKLVYYPLYILRLMKDKHHVKSHLSKLIASENIQLLYINTSSTFAGSWLHDKLGLPLIWHIREFGLEDQNSKMLLGEKNFYKKLSKCRKVITISKALAKKYEGIVNPDKLCVVHDSIADHYINPCIHEDDRDELNVLLIGSIIEGKGHKDALSALNLLEKRNCRINLYITGSAPKNSSYYESLLQYVKENDLEERVQFLGMVEDVNTLRKKMEIGLTTSKSEAFGRVTVENMLSNMIVVGSNCGSTPEIITDGVNGLLYEYGNAHDLADKLEDIYHNRDKYRVMADRGYTDALKYTGCEVADQLETIIVDAIREG